MVPILVCGGLVWAYAVTVLPTLNDTIAVQIDIPMLGATLGIAALQTSEFFGNEKNPRPLGSAHPRNAPYQAFRCSDGYFAMAAGNDKLWASVCDVVERPELSKDTRFLSTADRAANQVELKDILEEVFVQSSAEEWRQV